MTYPGVNLRDLGGLLPHGVSPTDFPVRPNFIFFNVRWGWSKSLAPLHSGPAAPQQTNIHEIAKTFFIGLSTKEKFAAKFKGGG